MVNNLKLRLEHAALVALVCGVLAGCEGGGGKVTLRFGTYNFGGCGTLTTEIDLAAGKSSIARLPDGRLDCALDLLLANEGCEVSFEQLPDGHTIRVRIRDCEIPPIADLFECGFSSADSVALRLATGSECECYHRQTCENYNPPLCNETPPVCIGHDGGPAACEICNNEIDDNGNGEADCDDEDCELTDVCGWESPGTTITCSTMTTMVTSTTLAVFQDADGADAASPERDTGLSPTRSTERARR